MNGHLLGGGRYEVLLSVLSKKRGVQNRNKTV